jgi:hypothetical protein
MPIRVHPLNFIPYFTGRYELLLLDKLIELSPYRLENHRVEVFALAE